MKSLIKTLAAEFGLSQQQIADYFGIHFSIVSRMASGDRRLPLKAVQHGNNMLQALKLMPPKKRSAVLIEIHDYSNRLLWLREQLLDMQIQKRQLQLQLNQLKQQQLQCSRLNLLLLCLENNGTIHAHERQKRWLAETHHHNKAHHKKCDAEQQWLIEIKLKGMALQQTFYEQQLSVIKNQINNS